jgi:hypothetical protein
MWHKVIFDSRNLDSQNCSVVEMWEHIHDTKVRLQLAFHRHAIAQLSFNAC